MHGLHHKFFQIRIFQSWSLERATSSEVVPDAHSSLPNLFHPPAMKLLLRAVFLVLARFGQGLQSLRESLRRCVPQPAPQPVPIPIQAERCTRGPVRRHPHRGG